MTPSHTAQGIASLGRNGDSMLMHVSPSEVGGLKQVGDSLGIKMTTNPYTGMPEAFNFGRFLTSLLPAAAGFAVGGPGGAALGLEAGTTAATIAPIVAGMATGAAVSGAQGDDMLMGSLMGGFGGYGGGNIATSMGNLGASQAAGNVASNAVPQGVAEATVGGAGNLGMFSGTAADSTMAGVGDLSQFGSAGQYGAKAATDINPFAGGYTGEGIASTGGGFGGAGANSFADISSGFKELTGQGNMPIGKAFDRYTTPIEKGGSGGSGMQLASTFGLPALQEFARIEPTSTNSAAEEEARRKAEENKYKDPRTGLLNLAQASPGLRLATGGTVNTNSSTISSGGIQDLYGTNDQTTGTQDLSKDGYGIGRLENLASQGSNAKAADTFYAMGGPIAFAKGGHQGYLDGAGDGMSDSIPATIEGKQPARLADGEFVIPADVVSHIGNGSSKAGSKQLYAMLDRIRKARTGHTKQGKEIKPNKYMPA